MGHIDKIEAVMIGELSRGARGAKIHDIESAIEKVAVSSGTSVELREARLRLAHDLLHFGSTMLTYSQLSDGEIVAIERWVEDEDRLLGWIKRRYGYTDRLV